jgi:hypothetical protein
MFQICSKISPPYQQPPSPPLVRGMGQGDCLQSGKLARGQDGEMARRQGGKTAIFI